MFKLIDKYKIDLSIAAIVILIIAGIAIQIRKCKQVKVRVLVKGHAVGSKVGDESGFRTIIQYEDGRLSNTWGLSLYVIPEGQYAYITETDCSGKPN